MLSLQVKLPQREYPIYIGKDAISTAANQLQALAPNQKIAVISDETVWSLHGAWLHAKLDALGLHPELILLPAGEETKSLSHLSTIYSRLCAAGFHRNDPIFAFGGGVIGDLAGFAAATFMRGVPLIQMPTTLLSQVDSSVGGKVAVNLPEGKNLVGNFYQPRMVIADTQLLTTLPERQWIAGMAEVVKYAAIGVEALAPLLLTSNPRANIDEIVYHCCAGKARIVEQDETDTSLRMILNFGHSFAHAIEKQHAYQTYMHGEAVAMGMPLAVQTGIALGITRPEVMSQLLPLMEAVQLPTQYPHCISDLIPLMAGDKKNTDSNLTLILLQSFGHPITHRIAIQDLSTLLERSFSNVPHA